MRAFTRSAYRYPIIAVPFFFFLKQKAICLFTGRSHWMYNIFLFYKQKGRQFPAVPSVYIKKMKNEETAISFPRSASSSLTIP